jgi:hypothetical protein
MALLAISFIRISVASLWLLSPPVLVVFALRKWKGESHATKRGVLLPLLVSVAVLSSWVLFVGFFCAGQLGGFGTHYMTTRLADIFVLFSILVVIASAATIPGRWQLLSASVLVLGLWFGSEMVA